MRQTDYLHNDILLLRPLEPDDEELMYRIENSPELWRLSNMTTPYSRDFLRRYIESIHYDLFIDRQLRLVIERQTDRASLGLIDLSDFNPLHNRAEVGIVIDRPFRRQGLARQALTLLGEYSFSYLHLHQLYAFVACGNLPSRRLFASCGYEECGQLRGWMRGGEERYEDAVLMQCMAPAGI